MHDTAMRFCYQSLTPFSAVTRYADTLRRHADAVVSAGTDVHFQGIRPELYGELLPGDVFPYPYLKHLIQNEALEACWQAERQGFDAFVIGSFSEPLLRQSRSAVDIPVVSMPESAFLTACSLAERFALITLSPQYGRRVSEVVARHGVGHRVAGIFPLGADLTERELNAALTAPDDILTAFDAAARQAIAAGADLLIPAEGILNEVLYLNARHRIDGAEIMDAVGVTLLHAEMLVKMKRRLDLGVGRAWSFPRAEMALAERLRANVSRAAPF